MLLFIIWSVFTCPSRDGDAAKPIFGARHCKPIFVKIIFKGAHAIVIMPVENEAYLLYCCGFLYCQVGIDVFVFTIFVIFTIFAIFAIVAIFAMFAMFAIFLIFVI